jgi:hypothetical protein
MNRDLFAEIGRPSSGATRRLRLIGAMVGAVLIAGVTLLVGLHRSDDLLRAEIAFDGYQFHITNRESAPLTKIEIVLNDRYVPRWKSLPPAEILPGETVRVPLAWFWTPEGTRLYLTDPVRHVMIRATIRGKRKRLARTYLSPH